MITGFFAFDRPGDDRLLSNWFLAAKKGNQLISRMADRYNEFWINNARLKLVDYPILKNLYRFRIGKLLEKYPYLWFSSIFTRILKVYPYYAFHYHFGYLYKNDLIVREIWDQTKKMPADIPHRLMHFGFDKPLDEAIKDEIKAKVSPVYKLSHKLPIAWNIDDSAISYLTHHINKNQ